MAKQNKRNKNTPQQISPKKYIRTQARSLELHECLINEAWEESQLAEVIISRKHKSGSITFAIYLVDLLCMGIKDTHWVFNISNIEYQEILNGYKNNHELISISYGLAHNIIFAGYEFALDNGLPPHADFTETTMYLLNKDNDNIELIDIKCGDNGKALILRGTENYQEATDTYHKVVNAVGEHKVIIKDLNDHSDFMENPFEEEDDLFSDIDEEDLDLDIYDIENFIYTKPTIERHNDINQLKVLSDNIESNDPVEFSIIINRLFYNYHGLETVRNSQDDIFCFFDVELVSGTIPNHLLDINTTQNPNLIEIIESINDGLIEQDNIDYKQLVSNNPNIPFFKYLLIKDMQIENDFSEEAPNKTVENKIIALLDQYIAEHPDYILLKLLKDIYNIRNNTPTLIIKDELLLKGYLSDIFNNRDFIHPIELEATIHTIFEYFLNKDDILSLDSLVLFIRDEHPYLINDYQFFFDATELYKVFFCEKKYNQ